MTIDPTKTKEIVHNNIPCTKTKINNLIRTVNAREDLSSAEKAYNEELLTYCITSTNGRTIEQKIQDLTEIIAHVACHSVESSLDSKDLSIRTAEIERALGRKIDNLEITIDHMNTAFSEVLKQIISKIDRLDVNINEKINKLEEKNQQNHEYVVENISDLRAYDKTQDKTVDLKLKYIDDNFSIQDQNSSDIVETIGQIANRKPWLIAFIVSLFVVAIAFSQRFVDFLKSIF